MVFLLFFFNQKTKRQLNKIYGLMSFSQGMCILMSSFKKKLFFSIYYFIFGVMTHGMGSSGEQN